MTDASDRVSPPASAAGADRPQYLALRDRIARDIEMGRLTPASRLPSERALQAAAAAARGTIRQALSQLEAEGLIYRRDRSGWYVSPPAVAYDPTRRAGFMAYVSEQGRTPGTAVLAQAIQPASDALADIFRLAPGAPLQVVDRLRAIDGRPVLVERIWIDPRLAPGFLERPLDGSLTEVLKGDYGLLIARNRIDMRPCALDAEVAALLGGRPGLAGLLVVRTSFDAQGRVVEYDREYWRHDAIRIHVDLDVRAEPAASVS